MGSTRREFLYAALAASASGTVAKGAGPYDVGVANCSSYGQAAYDATLSAIASSGGFPNVAGKVVVIKPNLVAAYSSESGSTTSIDVVRAVVDLALAGGAAAVKIVELPGLGQLPVPFTELGYNLFASYDPRVSILDLESDPLVLTPAIPGAFDFPEGVYVPAAIAGPNVVIIGVSKLKAHSLTVVSGATKNLFGFYSGPKYLDTTLRHPLPRGFPHVLGVDGSIVDLLMVLNSRCLLHVVDAVVAMQGNGPLPDAVFGGSFGGTPVQANCILAGRNPVAVDWVGAEVLRTPYPGRTMHLTFAAFRGLGPASFPGVTLHGDPLTTVAAQPAAVSLPPQIWPAFFPETIAASDLASGTSVLLGVKNALPPGFPAAEGKLEILRVNYTSAAKPLPPIETVRMLRNWTLLTLGGSLVGAWNGRNGLGQLVAPGVYVGLYSTRYVGVDDPLIVNTTSARLVVT